MKTHYTFRKRSGEPESSVPLRPNEVDQKVAAVLWKAVGGFGFLASLALLAGITSEKVGPDVLKFIGTDPHAITLFGIPLLSGILIATAKIGRVYSKATKSRDGWTTRIPPVVENVSESSLRVPVNSTILVAFVIVPWLVLGVANVKFFRGSYYYAANAASGCDERNMSVSCEKMGSGWSHFAPKYGIGSLTNTHYRYEANKTYVPVLSPLLLAALSILGSICSVRLLWSLFAQSW